MMSAPLQQNDADHDPQDARKYPICAASMGPTSGPAPAIAAK